MTRRSIIWMFAFLGALVAHAVGLASMNLSADAVAAATESEHEILLAPLGTLDGALEEPGEPDAPEEQPAPALPPPSRPLPTPTPPPPPPTHDAPAPTPEPTPLPAPDVAATLTTSASEASTTEALSHSKASSPSTSTSAAAPVARSQGTVTAAPFGLSNGVEKSQAQYAGLLQAWFLKHKRYPHPARSRRQQGVVKIWFRLDKSGNILEQRIETGSGYRILDKATLELLERATPVPRPPELLHDTDLTFTVPIVYSLN